MKKSVLFLHIIYIIYSSNAFAQNLIQNVDSVAMNHWVDSVMLTLTPDERLGQLILPIVDSHDDDPHRQIIRQDIETYKVGGFLFSKGNIDRQAKMTAYARKLSKKAPVWIALDGEWGLSMRLTDAIKYPRNGLLGIIDPAIRDSLMYQYGLETARQARLMGININFAPVLDVNSNPNNPVIGNRSFGSTLQEVIPPSLSYSRGLEEGGILAVGKHFPGHGDTDTDSHQTLPLLSHDRERMLSFECMPFRVFVNAGHGGIMVAHLEVPSLDPEPGLPSSLSEPIITRLLKEQFHFNGLVFTDGLAMKGVNNIPDYSVKALLAGVDVLVDPVPLKREWASLRAAISKGTLPQSLIDEKCRKVLRWKYALCVSQPDLFSQKDLVSRINAPSARTLLDRMTAEISRAKTDPTIRNHEAPAINFDNGYDPTEQTLPAAQTRQAEPIATAEVRYDGRFHRIDSLVLDALDKNAFPGCQILIAQHGQILYNKAFGWLDDARTEQNSLQTRYDLASVTKAVATVPALMHVIDHNNVKVNDHIEWYVPELRNTDKRNLTIRQALLHETGIREGYSFYTMTFDSLSLGGKNHYSGKRTGPYTVQQDRNCWFHNGLRFNPEWISSSRDPEHTLQVAEGMYLRPEFRDSVIQKIISLPLRNPGQYRYSDLNFVLLRLLVEKVAHTPLDVYLERELGDFYGAGKLCYKPLEHGIPVSQIAPTENDQALRHQHLRGYVHDETSAWNGGVEGNAGLFGSASDLFPLLQMLLDGGEYGGRRYLSQEVCQMFTTQKSRTSRRGLGFDKPDKNPKHKSPCADECSAATWGHTGYTGTCFWVDPKEGLVYIFLCNRVNPHRWNTTLTKEGYRTRIQTFIYEAIK